MSCVCCTVLHSFALHKEGTQGANKWGKIREREQWNTAAAIDAATD